MNQNIKNRLAELVRKNQQDKALVIITEYIKENPKDKNALLKASVLGFQLMDWDVAEKMMKKLSALVSEDDVGHWKRASDFYYKIGKLDKALECQRKIVGKNNPEELYKLGILYFKYFDFENAHKTFSKLNSEVPNEPQVLGILADIEHGNGEFVTSIEMYKKILKLEPVNDAAFNGIAKSTKFNHVDKELSDLAENILNSSQIPLEAKAQIHFSMGKMMNDCKLYYQAWEHYSKGNAIQSKLYPYLPELVENQVKEIQSIFVKELYLSKNDLGKNDCTPIFIIGMPRSGTTLLEQVLGTTGLLCEAGESLALNKAINKQFYNLKYPSELNRVDDDMFRRLADDYLSYLKHCHLNGDKRTVDKLPGNFLHLGILKKMFPNMKVINLMRNKKDCCLSVYFQMFANHMTFTNDLNAISHFYDIYSNMMEYWKQLFPDNIFDLSYEDLVSDFESQTKDLFSFLLLDWNENIQDFVNSRNSVHTPSSWQVRQGINTKAIGKSNRYTEYLEEFNLE